MTDYGPHKITCKIVVLHGEIGGKLKRLKSKMSFCNQLLVVVKQQNRMVLLTPCEVVFQCFVFYICTFLKSLV